MKITIGDQAVIDSIHAGRITRHGHACRGETTPEYRAFLAAKNRCNNPRYGGYENYGGRGVRFLFISFEEFFAELGPRPPGLTLDRKNNDGDYRPGNIRWATRSEQNRNQRQRKRGSDGKFQKKGARP